MPIKVGNESQTATTNNIPLGYYYYIIPQSEVYQSSYLGWVDTIQNLTYNPFVEPDDIQLITKTNFNTDRYGKPNGQIPNVFRLESFDYIDKELGTFQVYKSKSEIDDINYEPKLDMFPFRYFLITDYFSNPLLLKPQEIKTTNNTAKIRVKTTALSQQSKYNIYCEGYKGDNRGNLEGLCNTTAMQLPVMSSAYSQFIATSMSSYTQGNINAMLENDKTLQQGTAINNMNYNINSAQNNLSLATSGINAIGSLLSGNIGGALSTGLTAGMQYGLNSAINSMQTNLANSQLQENHSLTEYEISSMTQAKTTDMLNTPNSVKTAGNDTLFNLINSDKSIDVLEYGIDQTVRDRLQIFFNRFGYKQNKYMKLKNIIHNRKYFNYVKTSVCGLATAKVPNEYLEEIKNIFNQGVTIWHVETGVEVQDYDYVNNNGGNYEI